MTEIQTIPETVSLSLQWAGRPGSLSTTSFLSLRWQLCGLVAAGVEHGGRCWCGKNLCMDAQSHMKAKWEGREALGAKRG